MSDTEKVYGIRENKCLIEVTSKAETVVKENFVVLSGDMTISNSSSNSVTINYPTNFTKNNCVPIACGLVLKNDSNGRGYNFSGYYKDSGDGLNNSFFRRLNLTDSNIKLYVENPNNTELSITYKIVLMKVD